MESFTAFPRVISVLISTAACLTQAMHTDVLMWLSRKCTRRTLFTEPRYLMFYLHAFLRLTQNIYSCIYDAVLYIV